MTLEYASDTVAELLNFAEQLKSDYTIQINVNKHGFIRVYINHEPLGKRKELANLKQVVNSTDDAERLIDAVEDVLINNNAFAEGSKDERDQD